MPSKYTPQKYNTPSTAPKCVQYWERHFRTMKLWFAWIACKTEVEAHVEFIVREYECSKSEANDIVWYAFCQAVVEQESPLEEVFFDFKHAVDAEEFPLFSARLEIGVDIQAGNSESKATKAFRQKLLSNPDHGVFDGGYLLCPDFTVRKPKGSYITPRNHPKYVKFWDRKFQELSFWPDWIRLKRSIEDEIPFIQEDMECNKNHAIKIAWETYCDITEGDEDELFSDDYHHLINSISVEELPLYVAYTSIGTDMQRGLTEKQAIAEYIEWLHEDTEHRIFGDFVLLDDFTVIPEEDFIKKN